MQLTGLYCQLLHEVNHGPFCCTTYLHQAGTYTLDVILQKQEDWSQSQALRHRKYALRSTERQALSR